MLYLAQSDTTVGFLSHSQHIINRAKGRDVNQKVLKTVSSFKVLKEQGRVPKKHRAFVRRAKLSTFILPQGDAFRVIAKESKHQRFLAKCDFMYSSSANSTKKSFDEPFALQKADVIVKDERGFFEDTPSKIYKLSREKKKRLR